MYKENKPLSRRKPNRVDLIAFIRFFKNSIQKFSKFKYGNYTISIAIVALTFTFLYIGDSLAFNNRIHSGVSIEGIDVSGLTKDQALNEIEREYQKLSEKQLTIVYKEKKWKIKPSSFKVELNVRESVNVAFSYGRNGNLLKNSLDKIKAFKGISINGIYEYDKKTVSKYVKKVVNSVGVNAKDADIKIVNGEPVLIKSKFGYGLDYKSTLKLIISSLSSLKNNKLNLRTNKLSPQISNEEAKKSLKLARLMILKNISVRFKKKTYQLTKNDLAYAFTSKPINGNSLNLYFSAEKIQDNLSPKVKEIYNDPISATFLVEGNDVSITQSKMGQEVDFVKTTRMVTIAAKSKKKSIFLVVKFTKPKRTTDEAKKMGIKTLVSTFTTNYPPGKPRVKNIHRAAEILDKKLIPPGATFSFNNYVGQRTIEAGFVAAPEIRDGEFVDTVGGGVCQVSTTFFNAILLGGYPVGQRSPHSLYIKKYPNGRDSAVSWTQPDLTFTNDTKAWILIKAGYTASSITFSFYSTDYDRKVTFDTEFKGWNNFPTEIIKDNTLEKGKKKEKQAGKKGPKFKVTRTVVQNGKVIKKDTFTSSYRPTKRVVIEGTKKEKEKKEEEKPAENTN